MSIVTRFAPSPTGWLHIGSARTALFNYLFAKHYNGKFLLRIEDTDKIRSTNQAVDAIIASLKWLELKYDDEIVYQSRRADRHIEIANKLISLGKAYYCYQTQEETRILKEEALSKGEIYRYDKKWRDLSLDPPKNVTPAIRLKIDEEGQTKFNDLIQGEVAYNNIELDDLVILRSDGTPTYMLAVVVDDHDMNITHVIRGDDHLTNSFKQIQIYEAMGWNVPKFAHIALIHGPDGAKLSKRHGALGVEVYKEMGYLPEALNNYLLRLGWSHKDEEFIDRENAIKWFDLDHVGKSPSRIDFKKLENVNSHYIKLADNKRLFELIKPLIAEDNNISDEKANIILEALTELKLRSKNITELAESAKFYLKKLKIKEEYKSLIDQQALNYLYALKDLFFSLKYWDDESIEKLVKEFAHNNSIEFSKIGTLLRVVLTGSKSAPGIFKILRLLGRDEVVYRIDNIE